MQRRTAMGGIVSLSLFALLVLVLGVNWQRGLDAGYMCLQRTEPLPSDVIGEGGDGHWSWWPTGVVCSYPTEQGGQLVVPPDGSLSAVLVAAAVTALAGIVLTVLTVSAASKGSR